MEKDSDFALVQQQNSDEVAPICALPVSFFLFLLSGPSLVLASILLNTSGLQDNESAFKSVVLVLTGDACIAAFGLVVLCLPVCSIAFLRRLMIVCIVLQLTGNAPSGTFCWCCSCTFACLSVCGSIVALAGQIYLFCEWSFLSSLGGVGFAFVLASTISFGVGVLILCCAVCDELALLCLRYLGFLCAVPHISADGCGLESHFLVDVTFSGFFFACIFWIFFHSSFHTDSSFPSVS